MLTELTPQDGALQELLGATHQRFQRLVLEAEAKARPYYAKVLGREAGSCEHRAAPPIGGQRTRLVKVSR